MIHHGELYLRDYLPPRSKYSSEGRFGRLFPGLPPFAPDSSAVRAALMALGDSTGPMHPAQAGSNNDNPTTTAGFTFLGQFIDHDLTFDPTSSLERQNDPESIANFRTPLFELDNVYGSGRAASPHLYDPATGRIKFLIDAAAPNDLPRNSANTALIGDPRNDENVIVSQLQLAFLKFHNAVIDQLTATGVTDNDEKFSEAQRLVRWHYQWIVLHQFLPHIVGQAMVDDVLGVGTLTTNRRFFKGCCREPYIPVEFSVAAYRFGHSQVRPFYRVNTGFAAPFLNAALSPTDPDPNDLRGGKRAARRFVEWKFFFDGLGGSGPPLEPQASKLIDTVLSEALFDLPFGGPGLPGGSPGAANPSSLAQRNLIRGLAFQLPSGQAVARLMTEAPLTPAELPELAALGVGLEHRTPLWYYVLKEAEIRNGGTHLGPVGGRIVAEVFIGLLEDDLMSFVSQAPSWTPDFAVGGNFTIQDMLQFAGVA